MMSRKNSLNLLVMLWKLSDTISEKLLGMCFEKKE